MKKVVFFFPWGIVSGGPIYLCHLADTLAKTGRYEVYYTDYYNGLSDDYLMNYKVRKIPYFNQARSMKIFPEEPIIFITPVYWCFVCPELHPDSKIVFINWHNDCIPTLRRTWKTPAEIVDQFLKLIEDTDCEFFCDATHWMAQNELNIHSKPQYIPITIGESEVKANPDLVDDSSLNVAILGRLSIDKVYGDIDLIDNLTKYDTSTSINVHLIGEGDRKKLVTEHLYGPNIHIIEYGTLKTAELQRVLAEKADILFAMATSALEGARISLPTVILPNETHPFHTDQYVFLKDCRDYVLGWGTEQFEQLDYPSSSLSEIMNMIYQEGRKAEIGHACYQYFLQNHIDNLPQTESVFHNTKLTYSMLEPLLDISPYKSPKSIFERAVTRISMTIGKKVDQYRLLGIPVITRTERDSLNHNIYLFFIPLFREHRSGDQMHIHLLPLVWTYRLMNHFYTLGKKSIKKPEPTAPEPADSTDSLMAEENETIDKQERIQQKLRDGQRIRVLLFEPRIACWQFERLYHLLENSGIFEPIVVVIPFIGEGKKNMLDTMEHTFTTLQERGIRVVKGYDREKHQFVNIKEKYDPDAVFYSMFWKPQFEEHSYITEFEDIYTFLYPYGLDIVSHPWRESMNFELQNKVTRFYQTTIIHKGIAEDNMDNHGENVFVTGSPKLDDLFDPEYKAKDVWKSCGERKRVIWAPHHTILHNKKEVYKLNAFLELAEPMREIAETYRDTIQFVFKPHPMLRDKLFILWGKEKTDDYFAWWENGENTQLEEGEFIDLFLTSDAMILDSISFIGEYACTGKPSFFTYGPNTEFKANRFGRILMKSIYQNASSDTLVEEICDFFEEVVIKGNDYKYEDRCAFVNKYLRPLNGKSASENIYDDMYRVMIEDKCLEYKVDWATEEVRLV